MPQHSRAEVAELNAFASDDDRADFGLADFAKQSKVTASAGDDEEEEDLLEDDEDEDLDDDDNDDDQDEEDEDEDVDDQDATPNGSKAKGIAPILPDRKTIPEALLPAYDALAAAKKAQDTAFTQKTQALSQKLGAAEKMVTALEASGADLDEVSQMIVEMVEVSKSGGDPNTVAQRMSSPAASPQTVPQEVYDVEKVIGEDEELARYANALANPYGLSEDTLDSYEAAYQSRETALILAVEAHNRQVEASKAQATARRSEQLSRLKADPILGRIVTKNEATLLKEAQKAGVADLEMFARHRYFEDAIKRAEKRGSKRFTASRERNLDVGDGDTGRYDVTDTKTDDLDKGFEEGGLAGMIAVQRRGLTGRRKR